MAKFYSYQIDRIRITPSRPVTDAYEWTVYSEPHQFHGWTTSGAEKASSDPSQLPTWQRAECAAFNAIMALMARAALG